MKRVIDIIAATSALLTLSPLLVLLALIIRIKLGSPVLFKQPRIGLNNAEFELVKFRSMTNQQGESGQLLPDNQRLNRFGVWLRRTSLDELPTLWNVLCGQMSLVGPRPLLVQYLHLYSTQQIRRHEVKPGITGWAQINGRNALSWEQKFALDVWYVHNCNLRLDAQILFATIMKVLRRDDISAQGSATMPLFTGTKPSAPSTPPD